MFHKIWTISYGSFDMGYMRWVGFVFFQFNIDMSLTILGLECILLFRLTYSVKRYLTFAAIITNLLVLTCQARLHRSSKFHIRLNMESD